VTRGPYHYNPADHEHGDVNGLSNRLNWLRAGVLGANDGIVSVAGLVMGVAGATTDNRTILIAGIAALVSGALSMAIGEYVSVSTQRDAELALIEAERHDLEHMPEEEVAHLTEILEEKGLTPEIAREAARQFTMTDGLRHHAAFEFGIDVDDVTNPWSAAFSSLAAFLVGAALPVLTILLPSPARFYVTGLAVAVALAVTGFTSARLGGARPGRAVIRNVFGGVLAMAVTFGIGVLLGVAAG
jgi:VIT1/CCC1 family predicted Fe2+/Mn2+ transporter